MNILAFDTSTSTCSVALQVNDTIKVLQQAATMQQGRLILPLIQKLMDSSSLRFDQLDAIAYGCGPGSFTGLRIAASVAQGISFAANIPVISLSSLAALAQTAFYKYQRKKWLVAVDARMEQVYWAKYVVGQQEHVELLEQEKIGAPQDMNIDPSSDDWCGVGDGWEKYRKKITAQLGFLPQIIDASLFPSGHALLKLARIKLAKGDKTTAIYAIPAYLR